MIQETSNPSRRHRLPLYKLQSQICGGSRQVLLVGPAALASPGGLVCCHAAGALSHAIANMLINASPVMVRMIFENHVALSIDLPCVLIIENLDQGVKKVRVSLSPATSTDTNCAFALIS